MNTPTLPALRGDLLAIFRAALAAVDPARLVAAHLVRDGEWVCVRAGGGVVRAWRSPTLVVGAGKAAARMAASCEEILRAQAVYGEVIVAAGCASPTESICITEAGHPLPDGRGEDATRRILAMVRTPRSGGTLCLISGGASSLLVQPRPPLGLQDKITTTRLLLDCGADIAELNCVRKHLSIVKGGGLARLTGGQLTSLVISDVVGDDLGTIGSGPTAPDPTTFADAWQVIERYGLTEHVPVAAAEMLRNGLNGQIAETLKPHSPEADVCCNVIVGSNRMALEGAAEAARSLGWRVAVETNPVVGDTNEAARTFGAMLAALTHQMPGTPLCVLAGGETTVRVTGAGRGGRNQEFALALAPEVAGLPITLLSAGTDGIDGPTDAAGAFVDGTSLERARASGLDPLAALIDNDSYSFFAALGDLFRCGPTGTNVMDIKVALITG